MRGIAFTLQPGKLIMNMKHIYKILLLLILPISLLAQDTTVVKQQANILVQAIAKGDYKTLVDHTYPKLAEMAGGKDKMLALVDTSMGQLKSQGITFESASVGSPGKFYKAGTEIHCLVPETLRLKLPNGHATAHSYLLAISSDGGKNWSFVDLNKDTISSIPQIFPNFNPDLKIPDPTPPVMGP
jgi:hypothetical protein